MGIFISMSRQERARPLYAERVTASRAYYPTPPHGRDKSGPYITRNKVPNRRDKSGPYIAHLDF